MSKLYFKYGTMGAAKTAEALICKYRYEETGQIVHLLKPDKATRDDKDGVLTVRTRIGLSSPATSVQDFLAGDCVNEAKSYDVIIVDEAQFLTSDEVDKLAKICDETDTPVICYGLKTTAERVLFEGSKRLFELADHITEIKTVCKCGRKALFNIRISGDEINGQYVTVCRKCASYIERNWRTK